MKHILTWILALTVTTVAWGQTIFTTNATVNSLIPDNNQNGLATSLTLSGVGGPISSVTVSVDITGGFNGDLYAYLVGPNGGFAVLLNRSGVSSTSTYGYNDAGFNVTFSDTAANGNIHFYQNTLNPGGSALTGTWAPDGQNINPQSSPASFPAIPVPTATLSSFDGLSADGTWVFFISDLSAGGQSTLQSVGLTLAVPEPSTLAICGLSALSLVSIQRMRKK
jgi:subtilisin-like proprotein convertase family protein